MSAKNLGITSSLSRNLSAGVGIFIYLLCKGEFSEHRRCGEVGEEGLHGDRAVLEEAGGTQPQRPGPLVHEGWANTSVEREC